MKSELAQDFIFMRPYPMLPNFLPSNCFSGLRRCLDKFAFSNFQLSISNAAQAAKREVVMKKQKNILWIMGVMLTLAALTFSACGSSSSGPDTISCPAWNVGDSMTFLRTETVSGNSTETTMTHEVTDRTDHSVTLTRGSFDTTYSILDGKYIPLSEDVTGTITYYNTEPPTTVNYTSTNDYVSATAFCPPPAVGEMYEHGTIIPGPFPGSGHYVSTTISITGISVESVTIPAGVFTAQKIVMAKTSDKDATESTITRYYAAGIGVVKEVEEIPSQNRTITDVLTEYSYQ